MQRPFTVTLRSLGFTLSQGHLGTGASFAGGEDGAEEEEPEEGSELTVSGDLRLGRGRVLCGVRQEGEELSALQWAARTTVGQDRQGRNGASGPSQRSRGAEGQPLCSLQHCKDPAVFCSFEKSTAQHSRTALCFVKYLCFSSMGFVA